MVKNYVYALTKVKLWSEIILERQLRWLRHMVRLPDDTPVKLALSNVMVPESKPCGGQKLTWLKMIEKTLTKHNMTWNQAIEFAKNRKEWRKLIQRFALD